MTFQTAYPGMRCWVETQKDSAKPHTWNYFQSPCLPLHWIHLWAPPNTSGWYEELFGDGVVIPCHHPSSLFANEWRGDFVNLTNFQSFTVTVSEFWPLAPKWDIAVSARLLHKAVPVGPSREETWFWSESNPSIRGPHTFQSCEPISGQAACECAAPLQWEWWPSCDGIPEPGPTQPTIPLPE